jgi:hypothetical protein
MRRRARNGGDGEAAAGSNRDCRILNLGRQRPAAEKEIGQARSVCWFILITSGLPRSTRMGKHDREVGIFLGIEIEGTSICPGIVGKAVGNDSFPGWRSDPSFAITCHTGFVP